MNAHTKIVAPAAVDAAKLRQVLKLMRTVICRRNTIPILSNIDIDSRLGEMTIRATNLDQALVVTIPATGAPFRTTVALHPLAEFVSTSGAETVELSHVTGDRERLRVECGDAVAHLATLPSDDYPQHSAETAQYAVTLGCEPKMLAAEIDYVRPAISTEETRYYLNGIFIHRTAAGELRLVATDGHRLHLSRLEGVDASGDLPDTIIPHQMIGLMRELMRLHPGANNAALAFDGAKMRFRIGDFTAYSKTIDGTFPDYSRVIPAEAEAPTFAADTRLLVSAIDQTTSIATEKTRAVKVVGAGDAIALEVRCPETGEARAVVRGSDATGLTFEVGYNARYMKDIAGRLSPSRIQFEAADSSAPTRISSPDAKNRLAILMPMRV